MGTTEPNPLSRAAVSLCLGAALLAASASACSSPLTEAPPTSTRPSDRPSSSTPLPTPLSTQLPTEPPIAVPTLSGPPATSTPVDPGVPLFPDGPCFPAQLDITSQRPDAATGYRQTRVRVTNTTDVPCILAGRPVLQIRGEAGTTFTNPATTLTEQDGSEVRTVPLGPGDTAHVDVGWRADGAAAGVERADQVRIIVTEGSTPAWVDFPADALPLDIVDGTQLRIGGWRPGPD